MNIKTQPKKDGGQGDITTSKQRAQRLEPPPDCRVYIITSWLRYPFRAAP